MNNYSKYLKTEHWKNKRAEFFSKLHNSICVICGSDKNLNAHHKRYKSLTGKRVLFREHTNQLLPLCTSCHHKFHEVYGKKHLGRKLIAKLRKDLV